MRSTVLTVAAMSLMALAASAAAESMPVDRGELAVLVVAARQECSMPIPLRNSAMPKLSAAQQDRHIQSAVNRFRLAYGDRRTALCRAIIAAADEAGLLLPAPEDDPQAHLLGSVWASVFVCPDFSIDTALLEREIDAGDAGEPGFRVRVMDHTIDIGSLLAGLKSQDPAKFGEHCAAMRAIAIENGTIR